MGTRDCSYCQSDWRRKAQGRALICVAQRRGWRRASLHVMTGTVHISLRSSLDGSSLTTRLQYHDCASPSQLTYRGVAGHISHKAHPHVCRSRGCLSSESNTSFSHHSRGFTFFTLSVITHAAGSTVSPPSKSYEPALPPASCSGIPRTSQWHVAHRSTLIAITSRRQMSCLCTTGQSQLPAPSRGL